MKQRTAGGVDMSGSSKIKMLCVNPDCRVKVFMRGIWDKEQFVEESSGAWSMLKRTWCPGCSEEGEHR